jgi:hypothetical protein
MTTGRWAGQAGQGSIGLFIPCYIDAFFLEVGQ